MRERKITPTTRSIEWLQAYGWTVDIVERRITHFLTKDAFGFGDLLAFRGDVAGFSVPVIALVQVTTGSNMAARRTKILAESRARCWLQAGGRILLHGWRKVGKGPLKTWDVREEWITL